jgi:hypothetical protein
VNTHKHRSRRCKALLWQEKGWDEVCSRNINAIDASQTSLMTLQTSSPALLLQRREKVLLWRRRI